MKPFALPSARPGLVFPNGGPGRVWALRGREYGPTRKKASEAPGLKIATDHISG
jgi:hypothetical protein